MKASDGLTDSERATYQSLVARGVDPADAREDALDGVHVDDVRAHFEKEATPMKTSDRGFRHGDPIPSTYGGQVRAYESSAASHPHVWVAIQSPVDLNNPRGPLKEAVAHLTVENAAVLRDQLTELIDGHYQVSDPDPRRREREQFEREGDQPNAAAARKAAERLG